MIDFIWNDIMLGPMTNAIIVLTNGLFDSFGLGIIAFTLVIRFVTYPLTLRTLRTTRKMQEMQPRLTELQKKYKDPRRRQEEMMKLYKEVGFNPLGCVVPMLIQLPIWIALFQVIRRTVGTSPEALLGLSDRLYNWDFITEAVPLNSSFLLLDLGSPSIPLAFIVAIATFFQQKLTPRAAATNDRSASMNRTMLWMMPILFGWFTITVPAGLGLYWVVTSLFSITTQYLYYGRPKLTMSWLLSMETIALSDTSRALPEPAAAAASEPDKPPTQPIRRRRRRRRGSRSGAARREGTESSHDTSET